MLSVIRQSHDEKILSSMETRRKRRQKSQLLYMLGVIGITQLHKLGS